MFGCIKLLMLGVVCGDVFLLLILARLNDGVVRTDNIVKYQILFSSYYSHSPPPSPHPNRILSLHSS